MIATIHPYKGYLNTEFQLLSQSSEIVSYVIFSKDIQTLKIKGDLQPNIPHKVRLSQPGEYSVIFDNELTAEITVVDGYKFGGGQHKKNFIFDTCPWIFIVMHDRTYFHNRETGEEYVEIISPDVVEEVSNDYVLFRNNGQKEVTLYSLIEQKPVISASDILYHNTAFLAWNVSYGDDLPKELVVYSINSRTELIREKYSHISIDRHNNRIYCAKENNLLSINLSSDEFFNISTLYIKGQFGAFALINYAVYIEDTYRKKELVIYELGTCTERGRIEIINNLARINDVTLINVSQRASAILGYNLNNSDFPEAQISADYLEIDIYPCDQDTFYKETIKRISTETKCTQVTIALKSTGTELSECVDNCDSVLVTEEFFCIYGYNESVVIPFNYRHKVQHNKSRNVYSHKNELIAVDDHSLFQLNRHGFWEFIEEGDFDFSYYNIFGVVLDKKNQTIINNKSLGKLSSVDHLNGRFITDKAIINPQGYILWTSNLKHIPSELSSEFWFGIELENDEIYLYQKESKYSEYSQKIRIMSDLYDSTHFSHVFFSENGHQIMHRDKNEYIVIDLDTRETIKFDNLSYIDHINGIRPQFRVNDCSQAKLINPINGLPIDAELLNQYQFVSPDGQLYADKQLSKYIEYYDMIHGCLVSETDYLAIFNKFKTSIFSEEHNNKALENRKIFIRDNNQFLKNRLLSEGYKVRPKDDMIELIMNETNKHGLSWFLDLFIERRGIAVIRRTNNQEEVKRIKLGKPLWFLNYVSFSYDNQYVAIAGRYPNNSGQSGLLLIYDLKNESIIFDSKSSYAVWTTAFTKHNVVAAYTSSPNSVICNVQELQLRTNNESRCRDEGFPVRGINFLTFSPDGSIFAGSHQGYVPYRNIDGSTNLNWGHQPSSFVSIRDVKSPQNEIFCLTDLSDSGIQGAYLPSSVASVSFSNDNNRIMMVGNDGVVIIRNLYLNSYASE